MSELTKYWKLIHIATGKFHKYRNIRSYIEKFKKDFVLYIDCPEDLVDFKYDGVNKDGEIFFFTFIVSLTNSEAVDFNLGVNLENEMFYKHNTYDFNNFNEMLDLIYKDLEIKAWNLPKN